MHLFSHIQLEKRVPRRYPLLGDSQDGGIAPVEMDKLFTAMLLGYRPLFNCPETISARANATNIVHGTYEATLDGADQL